jgi:hypothetical protein
MTTINDRKPSRRYLLSFALAGAGAASASVAFRPARIAADTGDTFITGQSNNATTTTGLTASVNDRALTVRNSNTGTKANAIAGWVGTGSGPLAESVAVYGKNGKIVGTGVWGEATENPGFGVRGTANGSFGAAMWGIADGSNGTGVRAWARGIQGQGVNVLAQRYGLYSASQTGVYAIGGVEVSPGSPPPDLDALGFAPENTGVYGISNTGNGDGVRGETKVGRGVVGIATEGGVAVHATADAAPAKAVVAVSAAGTSVHAQTATGTALLSESTGGGLAVQAKGRVKFSSSGAAAIAKGARSRTLTNVDAPANCKILVTLNQDPGPGNAVLMARRLSATSIRVKLLKPAVRKTRFSWFVLV